MSRIGIKKIITSLCVLFLVINFLSPFTFSLGAFDFNINFSLLGKGNTILAFPPLGTVTADTHHPPLDIHLSLQNINLEQLEVLARDTQDDSWSEMVLQKIKAAAVRHIASLLILAFFLGVAVFAVMSPPFINKKKLLWGGVINLLALSLILLPLFITYDYHGFSQAQYEGILEAAPWVLSALEDGPGVISGLGYQLSEAVDNMYILQKEVDSNISVSNMQNNLKVLHVSDIHNNPASFDLILRVVDLFHVDLIIDTGDLVDYGTALEMEIFQDFFRRIDIPYIITPGNHESPSAVASLKEIEGVVVLEEGVINASGLRIAGIADPSSYLSGMGVAGEALLEETALKLKEIVSGEEQVDIIAGHNPAFFKHVRNNNNLILSGHSHSPLITRRDDYVEINSGTTGASGIRGLQNMDVTFSLALITMQPSETENRYYPVNADMIKVENFPLNYSLERYVFNHP